MVDIWFPDVETVIAVNRRALHHHGQTNHALRSPRQSLVGAVGRAQQTWAYADGKVDVRLATAAAALAYGIGQGQCFVDGNKRTAFLLTAMFLERNGLGATLPPGDETLADHLIGYGTGQYTQDDTTQLLRRRAVQLRASGSTSAPTGGALRPTAIEAPRRAANTAHLRPGSAKTDRCQRCGGSGNLPQFRKVQGGICFACGGTGRRQERR